MEKLIEDAYFSSKIGRSRTHYHDCYQIIYVLDGKIRVVINGKESYAVKGDLIIISRFENHLVNVLSDTYKRYVLKINSSVIHSDSREYSLFLNRPKGFENILHVGENSEFESVFEKIIAEYESECEYSSQMQELFISQLLIMIYRILPEKLKKNQGERLDEVLNLQSRLLNDCSSKFSLSQLASQYHVSVSTLSHKFKQMTGFAILEYVQNCRFVLAKNLLINTDLSVTEIVEKCGFSDSSNFSRLFKVQNGMSPTEYRKEFSVAKSQGKEEKYKQTD